MTPSERAPAGEPRFPAERVVESAQLEAALARGVGGELLAGALGPAPGSLPASAAPSALRLVGR